MSHEFTAKNGIKYTIHVDDEEITVYRKNVRVGSISLRFIELGSPTGDGDHYHITHLSLDDCKGVGVGRRCLELHQEEFGMPLTASGADVIHANDGSHLTGDGPGFIAAMRRYGIVCQERRDLDDDY